MATNLGTLVLKFTGDVTGLVKSFDQVAGKVGGLKSGLIGGLAGGAVFTGINAAAKALGTAVDLAAEFGDKIFQAGKYVAVMGSEFESTRVAFESLVGNTKIGRGLFEDLQKFAIETPFTAEKTLGVGKQLLGRGVRPEELMEIMRQIAEVSAGTGTAIELVGKAYADVVGKGKLMAQELNLQLGNAGIGAGTFAEALGVSTAKLAQMMEAGQVTGEMFQKAFKSLADPGGRFAGGMARQLQTVKGSWAQLVETIEVGAGKLGDAIFTRFPIAKILKEFSSGVGGFDMGSMLDKVERFGQAIKPAVEAAAKFGLGLIYAGQQFVEKLLPAISSGSKGAAGLIEGLFIPVVEGIQAAIEVALTFGEVLAKIGAAFTKYIATPIMWMGQLITWKEMGNLHNSADGFSGMIGNLRNAVRGVDLKSAFGDANRDAGGFFGKFAGQRGGVDPVSRKQEEARRIAMEEKARRDSMLRAMEDAMPGFSAGIEKIIGSVSAPGSNLSNTGEFLRTAKMIGMARSIDYASNDVLNRALVSSWKNATGGMQFQDPIAKSIRANSQDAVSAVNAARAATEGGGVTEQGVRALWERMVRAEEQALENDKTLERILTRIAEERGSLNMGGGR